MPAGPAPNTSQEPQTLSDRLVALLFQALPAIGSAIGFLGFVALVGAGIQWARFSAVGIPPNQAVHAASRGELVAEGALWLAVFVALGLLAVLIALGFRRRSAGDARLGFFLLAAFEVLVALAVVDRWRGVVAIAIWLTLVGLAVWALAAGSGPLAAVPMWALALEAQRLDRAERRWEDAGRRTAHAIAWLERLEQSTAPPEAQVPARAALARAIEQQRRAEDSWTDLYTRLERTYGRRSTTE